MQWGNIRVAPMPQQHPGDEAKLFDRKVRRQRCLHPILMRTKLVQSFDLIPKENYSDIVIIEKDYPEIFDGKFNYHLINNLSEAVNMSF